MVKIISKSLDIKKLTEGMNLTNEDKHKDQNIDFRTYGTKMKTTN